MNTQNYAILVYRTYKDFEKITLTAHPEYFSSIILLETGKELIQNIQYRRSEHIFLHKGEHSVAVRFKEDITTLQGCFQGCRGLHNIPEGLFDNCTKVKDFSNCFMGTSIATIPPKLFIHCTEIEDLSRCFEVLDRDVYPEYEIPYAHLQNIPSGLFDHCPKVKNFNSCFARTDIRVIPEGLFNHCSEVEDFAGCFEDCANLQSIPEGLFDHCPKVTDFSGCFSGTTIKTIPEGLFDHCPEVKRFYGCFKDCANLQSIPEGSFDHCLKVTDFSWCFSGTAIKTIPEKLFTHCTEIEYIGGCFLDCIALQNIPNNLFDNCTKIQDMSEISEDGVLYYDYGLYKDYPNTIEHS